MDELELLKRENRSMKVLLQIIARGLREGRADTDLADLVEVHLRAMERKRTVEIAKFAVPTTPRRWN